MRSEGPHMIRCREMRTRGDEVTSCPGSFASGAWGLWQRARKRAPDCCRVGVGMAVSATESPDGLRVGREPCRRASQL
jgi:hypothetical protein